MKNGMTMAEKILSRTSGKGQVKANDFVNAKIDVLMCDNPSFYDSYGMMLKNGCERVWDPKKIVVIVDHAVPAPSIKYAEESKKIREYIQIQGIKNFYDEGTGICNQVFCEKGHALPGQLIIGGDSHATTYGALGAASTGVGHAEVAYVMAKGFLWFRVPETIKFVLKGSLPKGITGKDIILKIAGQYSAEVAQYKAVEFTGPVARTLSIDQRMTISNMGVEIGAKFAFFEADEKTLAFLRMRTDQPVQPFESDPDAGYAAVYEMDISSLEPQVACPHNIDHVKSISEIGEVPVHLAFIGSCTNAHLEDLERAAAILKGRTVHPGTRLMIIPASREIYLQSMKLGAIQTFLEAGAMLVTPCCGPCGGRHLGVLAPGETAIASTNRNFKGRMGSPEGFVYLGSAETVAASAVEGKIADPRKYLD